MNRQLFAEEVQKVLDQCKYVLVTKGREYQSNQDEKNSNVFANFERAGNNVGINREIVLFVYLSKHWDSVCTFMRDLQAGKTLTEIESKLSEPINGRFIDVINYLLILNSMVNARRTSQMQPYGKSNKKLKGISGRRKSKASAHRRRSLRTDKKAARQEARQEINKSRSKLKPIFKR